MSVASWKADAKPTLVVPAALGLLGAFVCAERGGAGGGRRGTVRGAGIE